MEITKVETLEIDLSGEDGIALWRPIFERIHTDAGITGLGEASLAFGTRSQAVGSMIRKLAERFVLGNDPNTPRPCGSRCCAIPSGRKAAGGLTSTALQIADLFADYGVHFIEEPTHYNSPDAHLKVAS
ncbi:MULTISPECIES: hypothetical protein [unclassified Sinorhizobium]|uniref:hypothetical protein n=1 Tax=unclassified Sinorhizobium TaxID=2613772 RepID=UPI0024C38430|nr:MULTISPECIES: hypothetical protein [unclassified Sinorhizobium]MDK1376520.1 hypothetical protein [Sinorhizobium sp. 6-70]MDK1482118.1 hypothetical protein [Sinorhizobium sp. 6-117]